MIFIHDSPGSKIKLYSLRAGDDLATRQSHYNVAVVASPARNYHGHSSAEYYYYYYFLIAQQFRDVQR